MKFQLCIELSYGRARRLSSSSSPRRQSVSTDKPHTLRDESIQHYWAASHARDAYEMRLFPYTDRCVCVFGTWVSCAKVDEPIEMPFAVPDWCMPKEPRIRWRSGFSTGRGNFGGGYMSVSCKLQALCKWDTATMRPFAKLDTRQSLTVAHPAVPLTACYLLLICYLIGSPASIESCNLFACALHSNCLSCCIPAAPP